LAADYENRVLVVRPRTVGIDRDLIVRIDRHLFLPRRGAPRVPVPLPNLYAHAILRQNLACQSIHFSGASCATLHIPTEDFLRTCRA
jgi:hypothetical protein